MQWIKILTWWPALLIFGGAIFHNTPLIISGFILLGCEFAKAFSADMTKNTDRILSAITQGGQSIEAQKNRSGNEYELLSLNDAIVSELMAMRLDLARLRIKHDKGGWDSIPESFLEIYFMYSNYPYSALCDLYEAPNGQWAAIVILLDYFDDELLSPREFSAEALRKIKSPKKNKIARGMTFPVYLYEPETHERISHETKMAEVLSVTKTEGDGFVDDDYCLTLKIDLSNPWSMSSNKKEIIRKIPLTTGREYAHFVVENDYSDDPLCQDDEGDDATVEEGA